MGIILRFIYLFRVLSLSLTPIEPIFQIIKVSQPENRSVNLPDSLRRQFVELERRLWKIETAVAISISLIGICATFLALFFSDRFWDSPIWLRSILLVIALAVIIPAIAFWIIHWVVKRRDQRKLAVLVQKRFRRLGDRLLGIVELSAEHKHDSNFSPELYRAAINQVAEKADKYRFADAVETRGMRRTFAGLGCFSRIDPRNDYPFPSRLRQCVRSPGGAVSEDSPLHSRGARTGVGQTDCASRRKFRRGSSCSLSLILETFEGHGSNGAAAGPERFGGDTIRLSFMFPARFKMAF